MMDKLAVVTLASIVFFLTGCSYLNAKAEENQPTQREQQCMTLKNQLNFSKTDVIGSSNISGETSPTQKASLMQDYKKYNCTDFETKQTTEQQ
jgi:hypothetical protein